MSGPVRMNADTRELVNASLEVVTMFRPTGPKELELVAATGWSRCHRGFLNNRFSTQ
jgi:hypothetical protein